GSVGCAHGSGASRLRPRNRMVAERLRAAGLGTLLFDLLDPAEAADRARVFDIPLLTRRLDDAVRWTRDEPAAGALPLALFGSSTGAAAALALAADQPRQVRAVVSRGGRPDLAGDALERVAQPVLLIVGAEDRDALERNRAAQARLGGPSEMGVVPRATHLFEQPGALEEVAETAARWLYARLA
ncbi:MAG: dienelactone hydrolase family protein, partial [Gaiellales bacterium]